MVPAFDSEGFLRWQQEANSPTLDRLLEVVGDLNQAIADDPSLGPGFAVGHSYLSPSASSDSDAWLCSVVEDELIPLLDEYWFDEPATVATWAGKLRSSVT